MKRLSLIGLLALALSGSTGCVRRELVAFDDHATKPLTALRAVTTRNYLLFGSVEYVFYSCSEQGDKLDCKRVCGGENDTECPTASGGANGVVTNIR